jgi:hypothetical protein
MNRVPFLLLALGLAACSGPARVVTVPVTVPQAVVPEPVEAFDIAAYADTPAEVEPELAHDVPDRLMTNQISSGGTRETSGFRVQVYSTMDRNEAAATEDAVKAWWESMQAVDQEAVAGMQEPAVYRFFRQPYYRVRVGDFPNRARADRMAKLLVGRFPGSFVVPDRVTIRE